MKVAAEMTSKRTRWNPVRLCKLYSWQFGSDLKLQITKTGCVHNDATLTLIQTSFLLTPLSWLYKIISLPFTTYDLARNTAQSGANPIRPIFS